MFGGTALVLAKLLHQIKLLLSYDRLHLNYDFDTMEFPYIFPGAFSAL
jgi:hypothetical protein